MLARSFQACRHVAWTINPPQKLQVTYFSRFAAPVGLPWSADLCVHRHSDHGDGLSAWAYLVHHRAKIHTANNIGCGSTFIGTKTQLGIETTLQDHKKEQRFVDKLRIQVKAGSGGAGCVSFWKSPAKGTMRQARALRLSVASTSTFLTKQWRTIAE